jgi:hypothetical protein
MSHAPIQKETVGVMKALAEAVDEALNGQRSVVKQPRWGFALLVFPFGDPGQDRMNYIGNGQRDDVLVAIKELAARWEGRVIEPGAKQ